MLACLKAGIYTLLIVSVAGHTAILTDHSGNALAPTTQQHSSLSLNDLGFILNSLTGTPLDHPYPNLSNPLLRQDTFHRPSTVLLTHIVGATALDTPPPASHLAAINDNGPPSSTITTTITTSTITKSLASLHLHSTPINIHTKCTDICAENAVSHLATTVLQSHYLPQPSSSQPLRGQLIVPGHNNTPLDLTNISIRMWAVEIAEAIKAIEEETRISSANSSAAHSPPRRLFTLTLIGLQAMRNEYGSDSALYKAAESGTWKAANYIETKLMMEVAESKENGSSSSSSSSSSSNGSSTGNLVAVKVASLPAPQHDAQLLTNPSLLHWKLNQIVHLSSASRRRLLLQEDSNVDGQLYTNSEAEAAAVSQGEEEKEQKAIIGPAGWVAILMVLAGLIGAMMCLLNMSGSYNKDTLLFGAGASKKSS
jgi:hypothetical protein